MIRWEDLKKGDRIEVVELQEDPRPVPVGTKGTVLSSSRLQVVVEWDDPGHSLGLALPEDAGCVKKVAA